MGATELPDPSGVMGYGPARFLTPVQVREVTKVLADYPIEERVTTFDPRAANAAKVYGAFQPERVMEQDETDALIDYFKLLRDFYQAAADKGNAIVMWVQ